MENRENKKKGKKIKNFNTYMFVIMIVFTIFIVFIPLILQWPCVNQIISDYLAVLPTVEYKSAYISLIGSIVGSWLAITGAIWTQRKFEENNRVLQMKESALIVYYDFDFVFDDMLQFLSIYENHNNVKEIKKEHETFRLEISIDNEWIHNVAKLSRELTKNEIKLVYKLYGCIELIKKITDSDIKISDSNSTDLYEYIMEDFCQYETDGSNKEYSLKHENSKLMDRLKAYIND